MKQSSRRYSIFTSCLAMALICVLLFTGAAFPPNKQRLRPYCRSRQQPRHRQIPRKINPSQPPLPCQRQ